MCAVHNMKGFDSHLSIIQAFGINHKLGHRNMDAIQKMHVLFKILGYFFSGFCGLIWFAAIICILAWRPIGNPPDPTNLGLGIMLILVIFIQAAFTAFQGKIYSK